MKIHSPHCHIAILLNYHISNHYRIAETYNVIAEGLDCAYPGTIPDSCCNFLEETGAIQVGVITTANTGLTGGTIGTVFTAPSSGTNGSFIKSITIKAMQSTNEGMVRLWVGPDDTHFNCFQEIYIPQTTQSAFEPSFKQVVNLNLSIEEGYLIGASTQLSQSFAITVEAVSWTYGIS